MTTKALADQVTGSLHDAHEPGQPARRRARRHRAGRGVRHRRAAHPVVDRQAGPRDRHAAGDRLVEGAGSCASCSARRSGIGVLGGLLGIGRRHRRWSPRSHALLALAERDHRRRPRPRRLERCRRSFGQTTATVDDHERQPDAPRCTRRHCCSASLFALIGGLLAGLVGGWRAAGSSPAVALRDLG